MRRLWVNLRFKNSETLLVCVIYRHPKANINDFFDKLNNSLIKIAADNLNCVILGDVNIDLKTNEACGNTRSYLNMLNSNSFHNLIDLHTRIAPVSWTTIDHVYSNVFKYKSVPGIVKCALTDHYPIKRSDHYCLINIVKLMKLTTIPGHLKNLIVIISTATLKHRWINCEMTRPIWMKKISINSSPLLFRSLN